MPEINMISFSTWFYLLERQEYLRQKTQFSYTMEVFTIRKAP